MTHASIERQHNLIGAFALALSDRISAAIELEGGPAGTAGAALLLIHHGSVGHIDDLRPPLALTQAGVARLVDRLVAAGLVRRVAAADGDGRKVGLALTRSGGARARALMRARERAIAGALDALSPAQTAHLGELADRLLAAAAREHAAPGRLCRYCDEQACDLRRCPVELAATEPGAP
jgi:MarR family transcriptional regulator, negative regulator of the multidrug operon emrRAB